MIRPQGLRPSREGDQSVPGRVAHTRFLGETIELVVQFERLEEPLISRIASTRCVPKTGETLGFSVDPDHVLLFPAPG
jgi:hypothetical protein